MSEDYNPFTILVKASLEFATMKDEELEDDAPAIQFRNHCRAALERYATIMTDKTMSQAEHDLLMQIKEAMKKWK